MRCVQLLWSLCFLWVPGGPTHDNLNASSVPPSNMQDARLLLLRSAFLPRCCSCPILAKITGVWMHVLAEGACLACLISRSFQVPCFFPPLAGLACFASPHATVLRRPPGPTHGSLHLSRAIQGLVVPPSAVPQRQRVCLHWRLHCSNAAAAVAARGTAPHAQATRIAVSAPRAISGCIRYEQTLL